jgi:hypothetical protein
MWPFKKHLQIDSLNDETHKWSVAEASGGAGPMLIRINTTAQEWFRHPLLSIRVGFAIPLKQQNPQRLPAPEENIQLDHVEDVICSFVKSTGPSIHVLAIATGTFKEFVFYIKNGDRVAEIHKQISKDITSHEVQCVATRDPKWSVYASFAK